MTNIYLIKTVGGNTTYPAYLIGNLNNLNWTVDTPVTPMPLPEDSHEENILIKMEGNTAKLDISWTMTEGAYFGHINYVTRVFTPDASKTVYKQIKEFKEEFVPISVSDAYAVLVTDDNDGELLLDEGVINNMSFSVSGSSPVVWNVNCSFYVGNAVAVLEADIPPAPDSVTITGGAQKITYSYVPYSGHATVPTGTAAVTGVKIKYAKDNGAWEFATAATSATELTGLTAGLYKFRLAELNGFSEDSGTQYYKTGRSSTESSTVTVT